MASDRAQILISAVDQTRQAFATVNANLEKVSLLAGKLNSALGALGVALSLGALVAAGKHALDTADEFNKLAQKTGVSVESLSLLKPVLEQSGSSLGGFEKALKKLSAGMVEAAAGSKEQAAAFGNLGVAVKDSAGNLRPAEAVMLDLADVFKGMPDGAEKAALAVKLFGKAGMELIPFLNQGSDGIRQMKGEFQSLGLEVSGKTAAAAEKFNDTLDTVKQALAGIAMKITAAALPALQSLAAGMVALARHSEGILTALRLLSETVLMVMAYRTLPALVLAWQSVGPAAVAAATTLSAAWKLAVANINVATASLGILRVAFLVLSAFLAGWEIGTWLAEKFAFVRKAGILMVEGLMKAIEVLQYGWEAFLALFTSDTLDAATARHNARLAQMNDIFAAMYAGASQGANEAGKALGAAGSAAEALNRRLEAARLGLQTAVTQGVERVQKAIEALKTRLGEIDQAIGKSQAVMTDALARMGESYKTLTGLAEEAMNRQLAAVRTRYAQEKAELESSHASQAKLLARTTQLLVEALTQETTIRQKASAETLRLIDAEAKVRIDAASRQGATEAERAANVRRVENEILATKRQTLEQSLADYQRHVDALNSEANRHLAEIKRIEDEKRQWAMSTQERIRDLLRQGLTEAEATEDKKLQITQYQTRAREALAAGEFDQAKEFAKKALDLAAQVASEQTSAFKRATDERQRLLAEEGQQSEANAQRVQQQDAAISKGKAEVASAIGKIRESEEILNKALDAEGAAHQQAAQAASSAGAQIQQTLTQTQTQVDQLTTQLNEGASLQIDVNTTRLDAALAQLDTLFAEKAYLLAIDADLKSAEQKMMEFTVALQEGRTINIDADVARAQTALEQLKTYAQQAGEFELNVKADQALAAVDEVRGRIAGLKDIETESRHQVSSNVAEVANEIDSLNGRNTSSTHTITTVRVEANALGGLIGVSGVSRYATGGAVSAGFPPLAGGMIPGSGDQDTVPRRLDAGAFVIRKAAVQKYGSGLLSTLARFAHGGQVQHFAGGGAVFDFAAFWDDFKSGRGGSNSFEDQFRIRNQALAAFIGLQAGVFTYDEAVALKGTDEDIRKLAMRRASKQPEKTPGPSHYAAGGNPADTVPAMLTPGEYVVNRTSVNKFGVGFFDAINRMKLPARALVQRVQGFAAGGLVPPSLRTELPRPTTSEAAGEPQRSVRVELVSGERKVNVAVDARDETRLLNLLASARLRTA
jgi:phage-related minor tail protein